MAWGREDGEAARRCRGYSGRMGWRTVRKVIGIFPYMEL
jgi:hypothetical protein